MLDERWIRALHVEALRQDELHAEREPHVLFEASTIGALLDGASSFAVRLDGRFARVRARSVPRQSPPYRPLTEVVAEQSEFELVEVVGTMLGFRFPSYVEGIEVPGFHLHFIDEERSCGGHVLDSRPSRPRARLDPSNDLHVELPPRVDLGDPDLSGATHAAMAKVERG